jgi:hypothetical protein
MDLEEDLLRNDLQSERGKKKEIRKTDHQENPFRCRAQLSSRTYFVCPFGEDANPGEGYRAYIAKIGQIWKWPVST